MTIENTPPMFGSSPVFDVTRREPRAGKSATTVQITADLCSSKNNGHHLVIDTTQNVMSSMWNTLQRQYVDAGGVLRVVDKGPTMKR
jgi:hypothetical protein